MAKRRGSSFKRLYPELGDTAGLADALTSAFEEIGSPLVATVITEWDGFPIYARVEHGMRHCHIYIAEGDRRFLFDFWSKGVSLARAEAADLAPVAEMIDAWVAQLSTTRELSTRFDGVQVDPNAEIFEDGREVDWAWEDYHRRAERDLPALAAVIGIAYERPLLRQLFPYVRGKQLRFSRCTGYPYTHDCPSILAVDDGDFEVRDAEGTIIKLGDAATAVDIVVNNLPRGIGPAVPGTAQQFD